MTDKISRYDNIKQEHTIKNYRRSRKFGWGWTCTPTGEDAYSIETPAAPDYTGTLNQLDEARRNDATFNSLGGAFFNTAYFYRDRRITHTWVFTFVYDGEDTDETRQDAANYGYAWVAGFDPPDDEPDITIRTE